jgi:hypothetical protein
MGGCQWRLQMKELCHFVGVSVQVILVEYEDSLENRRCIAPTHNEWRLENTPGRAHRPDSTRCPFSACAHPRGMQGPQPPRFQSLYGEMLRDFPICQRIQPRPSLSQIAVPLYVMDSCVCLFYLSAEVSQVSAWGRTGNTSPSSALQIRTIFGARGLKGDDRIGHTVCRQTGNIH